jgi:HPt (histidine-containing phosphotransfer) domain-containing protein
VNNPSSPAVFSRQAALERMGFDQQLYEEMVRLLVEDCPRRLAQLQSAVDACNLESAQHAAHSLKGLAANFSAHQAVRSAAAIERGALDGRWDLITAGLLQIQEDFKVFLRAVGADSTGRELSGAVEKSRDSSTR